MLTNEISGFIIMGSIFGVTAGLSPGPLLTLVITETLRHNKTEGIKVAIAPLLTDLPIITLALLIFSRFSHLNILMSMISFLGSIFLVYLGFECVKTKGLYIDIQQHGKVSLIKGIIVNLLNPHPYLFWITVGAPIAIKAYQISLSTVIIYFLSFYSLLIGSKICVALIVGGTKTFISDRLYVWIMRILGFSLFIFALLFFFDGIKRLN